MKLHTFLRTRRSIRRLRPDPIPRSVIKRILTTATYSPSAHNRQPWRFVVLTQRADKARLSDSMAREFRRDLQHDGLAGADVDAQVENSRARILAAPVVVVLCMDASEMDSYPDSRRGQAESTMAIQSTANAGLALLLAVHAESLGGTWVCAPLFAPNAVRRALRLHATWEPQAMFLIGRPAEVPRPRKRKALKEVAVFR